MSNHIKLIPTFSLLFEDGQKVLKHNFDTKITSTINSSNCKVPGVAILVCLQSRFAMSSEYQPGADSPSLPPSLPPSLLWGIDLADYGMT